MIDFKKYHQQVRDNQLVGVLLTISTCALAIILWIIAHALTTK